MRASSYIIHVDLPDDSKHSLIVHGYTGAFDKVSRPVADLLRSMAPKAPKPLHGEWAAAPEPGTYHEVLADATIDALRKRGYITDLTVEAERDWVRKIATKAHEVSRRRLSYLFMPTYNCNLRCAYCFQDHMRTDGRFAHLLRTMTEATVDRIFLAMRGLERANQASPGAQAGPVAARNIGFFGGEPLLASSRTIVEYILRKALEEGPASFWAVTNATELDAYEDLLGPGYIAGLQVTLDGPPGEHDRRRVYADGSGSFAVISHNIDLALSKGVAVSVRLNIDRENIKNLCELADVFETRGWSRHQGFSAYAAPIHACNKNVARSTTMSSWDLDQQLASMKAAHPSLMVLSAPDDGLKNQIRRLFGDPEDGMPQLRESFCSAHTGMFIFDAFADVYACWERTGDPALRIGAVDDSGRLIMNEVTAAIWRTRTVATNEVCLGCRYALFCGGGCAVLAQAKTGNYHTNFCDGFGSRFRSSVADAYQEHVSGTPIETATGRVCDQ